MELSSELRYHLLKVLEQNPDASQRDLAKALGISLGKTNYCIQALIAKGLIKATNFKNSRRKVAYMYYLTPAGIDEKARVAVVFLRRKLAEIEELRQEIEAMRSKTQRKDDQAAVKDSIR